jgi:NTP pyrophosphatase (non-canonical NTP hydrolase)
MVTLEGADLAQQLWNPAVDDRLKHVSENRNVQMAVARFIHQEFMYPRLILVGRNTGQEIAPYADLRIELKAARQTRLIRKATELSLCEADPAEIEKSEPDADIVRITRGDLVIDTTHLPPAEVFRQVAIQINDCLSNVLPTNSQDDDEWINVLQDRIEGWQRANFPQTTEWELILGCVEELGELSQNYLKLHRGIRTDEFSEERLKDAIGDLLVFLIGLISARGYRVREILENTVDTVTQRQWNK